MGWGGGCAEATGHPDLPPMYYTRKSIRERGLVGAATRVQGGVGWVVEAKKMVSSSTHILIEVWEKGE